LTDLFIPFTDSLADKYQQDARKTISVKTWINIVGVTNPAIFSCRTVSETKPLA